MLTGESGVGKSTWIDAFANYCTFSSGGVFPVPCTIQIPDPTTKQMVTISSDGNDKAVAQATKVGESVTQSPDVYSFQYENTQINVLDTPGMNDTQGHDRDKEHVNNILKLLSTYHEIHAICILLKASESRLSDALKYALTELMRHLDTDACNSVIFIFTYGHKPDQTQSILQEFLTANKIDIPLPPTKPTIYCFENQAVNYIVQCKNKIAQSEDDEEDAMRHWKRSVRSTTAMFHYVCSLKPHSLVKINKIHNAEHLSEELSRIVLDILMCIFEDESKLYQKKKDAETLKQQIVENPAKCATEDLKKLLYVTESKVVRRGLDYTNVVCEASRCCKVVNGKIEYPQVCCEHCISPWMDFCLYVGWTGECRVCGCEQGKHQWSRTETQIVEEVVYRPDDEAVAKIVNSDQKLSVINKAISENESLIKKCKSEGEMMLKAHAQLNSFVSQNVLTTRDDKLSTILKDRIEAHEAAAKLKHRSKTREAANDTEEELEELKRVQCQYDEQSQEMKKKTYSVEDLDELMQEIYKLPQKGEELRKAMEVEEDSKRKFVQKSRNSHITNFAGNFAGMAANAMFSWLKNKVM